MAGKQIEVPGTERKYTKHMREAGDAYAASIKVESKAKSKRKDEHAKALAQMEKDEIEEYVDTESDPPFILRIDLTKKVKKSAYKAPKPKQEFEGD